MVEDHQACVVRGDKGVHQRALDEGYVVRARDLFETVGLLVLAGTDVPDRGVLHASVGVAEIDTVVAIRAAEIGS
jgi:hypothetical protein